MDPPDRDRSAELRQSPSIRSRARGVSAVRELTAVDRGPRGGVVRRHDHYAAGKDLVRARIIERHDSRIRLRADRFSATDRHEEPGDRIRQVVHELGDKMTEADAFKDTFARLEDADKHWVKKRFVAARRIASAPLRLLDVSSRSPAS